MRLAKLGVYYPKYLKQFYSENLGLSSQSAAAQHEALINDCFGSSDFWTHALKKLGYDTAEWIANAEPLQKRWAQERGVSFGEDWFSDILLAQLQKFSPEVLLVADYSTVTAELLKTIRQSCPSLRLVLGWCGAPYSDDRVFRECDAVLSCVPELVAKFENEGIRSTHINHAFDSRVLKKVNTAESPVVFSFIGSVFKSTGFHIQREQLLKTLVRETPLMIWSDVGSNDVHSGINDQKSISSAGKVARSILGSAYRTIRNGRPNLAVSTEIDAQIIQRAKSPLFGLRMFQKLSDSQITLNTHIDISVNSASNLRLFEATGSGTCLLTDWKSNLAELFEPDSEVVSYRSAEECVEKVQYLLDHPSEREQISAAGHRRTLRDHSYDDRAGQLHATINTLLK
jgi:spore maturation protein CgeB